MPSERTAAAALSHRGPALHGLLRGHPRLGNIAPPCGAASRSSHADPRSVSNGEIYNHRQLSAALQGLDAEIHASSNTEVVWWEIVQ
jgi:asparagine synthetase B (glutamine-hydrolysing)